MSDRQSWLVSLIAAAVIGLICLSAFRAGVQRGRTVAEEESQKRSHEPPGLRLLEPSPSEAELEQNARESLIGMQREFERMKYQLKESRSEVKRLKEQLTSVSSIAITK